MAQSFDTMAFEKQVGGLDIEVVRKIRTIVRGELSRRRTAKTVEGMSLEELNNFMARLAEQKKALVGDKEEAPVETKGAKPKAA